MYKDDKFMRKLHAQFSFLKIKAPVLMIYLNYFQQRLPHATDVHGKLQGFLHYREMNSNLNEDDVAFCFEGESKFTKTEKR